MSGGLGSRTTAPTPNQIARSLLAGAEKQGGPEIEAEVLARAFLAAADAWRSFDQQALDEILLNGDSDV